VQKKTNLNNAKAALETTKNEIRENEEALSNAGKKTTEFNEKWSDFARGAGTVAVGALKGIGAAVGVVAGAAVAAGKAIIDLTKEAGKWADELDTTSKQTGVSTQTLQEWSYAARFVDVSVETMTKGMAKTVSAMGQSIKGGQDYIEVMGGMQVALYDTDGQLKSTEQVFYDTIDALGAIEDATLRDIAAQDIFGKSYQEIKPLIDAGSEALLRYAAEAQAAGLILSDDAVGALGKFDDQMQRVEARLETAGRLAAVSFLPAISEVVGGVTEILSTITTALSDGFQESDVTAISDAITKQITLAVDSVGRNAPAFIGVVSNVITSLAGMIVDLLPAVLPTLVTAAIQIITGIFATIQQNAAAISQAVVQVVMLLANFLVESLPLLIETGLAIVIALAQGIAQSLPELIPSIVAMVLEIVNVLTNPETVVEMLNAALQIIIALAEGLIKSIPEIIKRIPRIVMNIAVAFVNAAPQLWESGKALIAQMWEGIVARFAEVFLSIAKLVSDNIVQPVKDKVSEFFNIGKDLIVGIWNGISDKVAWLKQQVKGVIDKIKSWFTGKDGFDNNSPSKWGIQMGSYITQGVGIGFKDGLNEALASAGNVISKIKSTMSGASFDVDVNGNPNAYAKAGGAPQYIFHIYARDKETAIELSDATLAAFQRGRWAVPT
jgi:phage-related protein